MRKHDWTTVKIPVWSRLLCDRAYNYSYDICQCILVIFVNLNYILLAKPHAAVLFVFCGFLREWLLFPSTKLFNKSMVPFLEVFEFCLVVHSNTWFSIRQVFYLFLWETIMNVLTYSDRVAYYIPPSMMKIFHSAYRNETLG